MYILIILLIGTINSEPIGSTNHSIATYILENLNSLDDKTISCIADEIFVSKSSLSRFCRSIGLEDFNDFREQISRHTDRTIVKFPFKNFDENNLIDSYIDQVTTNLNDVKNSLDIKAIEKLVEDIKAHDSIYALGHLQSAHAALNLQADMITNGVVVNVNSNIIDQIEIIEQADKNDLIIIFSQSGNFFNHVYRGALPKFKKNKKPNIYMITMNEEMKKLPFIKDIIHYKADTDYSAHPYPSNIISSLIALTYATKYNKL